MNRIIVSDENKKVIDTLRKEGFKPIFSEEIKNLLPFERKHADMQCLKIKDAYFVLKSCKTIINKLVSLGKNVITTDSDIIGKYPENILLNAVYLKDKLYCKENSLDTTVKNYCKYNGIEIVNVNQGYAKCSTALIDDSFITSDRGIFNKISENGVEGLLIESGDIALPGTNYGFIGGCCFGYNDKIYFSGDITKHKEYKKISDFITKHNKKTVNLSDEKLYDVGGFIVV